MSPANPTHVDSGLFYVIDGFLDILLPTHKPTTNEAKGKAEPADEEIHATRPGLGAWGASSHSRTSSFNVPGSRTKDTHKPLFTVRPGGIAGYLCKCRCSQNCVIDSKLVKASLCQIASYVDIVAKTDTYVGFLPSPALDRLLEKRPIVLLTLAKRLISLLSPIGRLNARRKHS